MPRVLLLALVAALAAVPAAAAAGPQLTLESAGGPLHYALAPGAIAQGVVVVTNRSTSAAVVRIRARGAAATWVSVSQRSLSLAARAAQRVRFTIRVPAGTTPGTRSAALAASAPGVPSALAPVTIVVAAPRRGPSLTTGTPSISVTAGSQSLTIPIRNTGGPSTGASGTVKISDAHGRLLRALTFSIGPIAAGAALNFPVAIPQTLPAGTYRVAISIPPGARAATSTVGIGHVVPPPPPATTTTARTRTHVTTTAPPPTTTAPTTTPSVVIAPPTSRRSARRVVLWAALAAIYVFSLGVLGAVRIRR